VTTHINTTPLAVMLKQFIHPTYFYTLTSFLGYPPSPGSLHVSPQTQISTSPFQGKRPTRRILFDFTTLSMTQYVVSTKHELLLLGANTLNYPSVGVLLQHFPSVCYLCPDLKEQDGIVHLYKTIWTVGRDSSVGIATRYGLDGPGIESRCG
jgi:hypothetical protein